MPVSAVLPCLDRFIITPLCVLPSWYLTIIADCLSMPHLRHLQVTLVSSNAGSEPFSLASLGEKLPLLEYLAVQLDTLGSQSLPEILRSFPSLARRVVEPSANRSSDQSCDTTQLMQSLMDRTICPRLQELEVRSSSALSKSTLKAFLNARAEQEHSYPLQRLRISLREKSDEEQLGYLLSPQVQAYIAQGLDIVIFPPKNSVPSPTPWRGLPRQLVREV
ncbi:hypothetical protein R3P38DRAFT_3136589 [Favolaschia claudopus]|uniref:Uncharacterized protein n=1 Tax=Favolaschia claudopus TaxID=2862362 RepID=A0AAV9Z6Y4_9AGAR